MSWFYYLMCFLPSLGVSPKHHACSMSSDWDYSVSIVLLTCVEYNWSTVNHDIWVDSVTTTMSTSHYYVSILSPHLTLDLDHVDHYRGNVYQTWVGVCPTPKSVLLPSPLCQVSVLYGDKWLLKPVRGDTAHFDVIVWLVAWWATIIVFIVSTIVYLMSPPHFEDLSANRCTLAGYCHASRAVCVNAPSSGSDAACAPSGTLKSAAATLLQHSCIVGEDRTAHSHMSPTCGNFLIGE